MVLALSGHRWAAAAARLALLALCLHVPSGAFCCRDMATGAAVAVDGAGPGNHQTPGKAPAGGRRCQICKALCAQAALSASPPAIAPGIADHSPRQGTRSLRPGANAAGPAFLARGPPGTA